MLKILCFLPTETRLTVRAFETTTWLVRIQKLPIILNIIDTIYVLLFDVAKFMQRAFFVVDIIDISLYSVKIKVFQERKKKKVGESNRRKNDST